MTTATLSFDDEDDRPRREWLGLAVVLAAHAVVLAGLTVALKRPDVLSLPTITGVLVPTQEVAAPKPLPVVPEPKPKPRPVVKPRPIAPPVVRAPPSERAISLPPPEPDPPAAAPAAPPAAPVAVAAAPAPVLPVALPRSDAAYLNNPAPVYPNLSRRMGEQGKVVLSVFVLASGEAADVRVATSSGHARLDEAALQAVRRWRFVPAKRGDTPIDYRYKVPITFSLES